MIYDVIVVGSGPGGAIAAATLAQRGKSVLLVDRQSFPRDKPCGDGMPHHVMKLLVDDFDRDFAKLNFYHQRVGGLSITAPSGKELVIHDQANPLDYSMVSPRYHFDHMLHQYALRLGAKFEVMQVSGPLLSPSNDSAPQRVVGIVERRGTAYIEHEARIVIAADGASSAIASGLRGRVADTKETAIAIRAYAQLKRPLPEKPLIYFKYSKALLPGYAWVFPVESDRVNVGVGLFDQEMYRQNGKSLKVLLSEFIDYLGTEFQMDIEPGTVKSWPIPVYTSGESRVVSGAYLVGDAGRFADALTGEGIYPAMLTGQLAGQAAVDVLNGKSEREAARQYDVQWHKQIGRTLKNMYWVRQFVASRPRVFNALFAFALAFPNARTRVTNTFGGQQGL